MSHHAPQKPTDITIPDSSLWAKTPVIGGVLAVVGLGAVLGSAASGGEAKARAMFSYLWAFELFLGLALAALGYVLIDHCVRTGWSTVIRRLAETMAVTLPVFAVLFIPLVAMGYHDLWPWTHEADTVLDSAGITVVPDVLANAGGVTGSYFEWTQNIQQFRWALDRVNQELEVRMVGAFGELMARAVKDGTRARQAAFDIAVERVARAIRLRGFV